MFTSTKALWESEAEGLLSGAAASSTRWPYLDLKEEKTPERMLLALSSSSTCRSLRPESCRNKILSTAGSRERVSTDVAEGRYAGHKTVRRSANPKANYLSGRRNP